VGIQNNARNPRLSGDEARVWQLSRNSA